MMIKNILKVTIGTLLCSITSMAPAFAARIYNSMDQRIWVVTVTGSKRGERQMWTVRKQFSIEPGERSESLQWPDENEVFIYQSENPPLTQRYYIEDEKFSDAPLLCNVRTGTYNQIQGGNYMTVEPGYDADRNPTGNCYICNASDQVIYGKGKC